MGVDLSSIVDPVQRNLSSFSGKILAIDAYNSMYQFLATIRQPDGTPLMDGEGRVTSHLSGLLYRTANMAEAGIKPVFVFDGAPPVEKSETLEERSSIRQKAWEEWQMAREAGDMERARTKAQQSSRMTKDMAAEAKQLLVHMGIPIVQAPGEGEAQASHMALRGDVWGAASQDYDSILFGTPVLVRNLAITGRRKMPRKNIYVDVHPEEITLENVLSTQGLTREQLVDLAILVGTDFNPGIKGVGPKKALKAVKENELECLVAEGRIGADELQRTRNIFLEPSITNDYALEWKRPSADTTVSFLCGQRGFSETRVLNAVTRLEKAFEGRSQTSLDKWF